jgi:hypothetical protein
MHKQDLCMCMACMHEGSKHTCSCTNKIFACMRTCRGMHAGGRRRNTEGAPFMQLQLHQRMTRCHMYKARRSIVGVDEWVARSVWVWAG